MAWVSSYLNFYENDVSKKNSYPRTKIILKKIHLLFNNTDTTSLSTAVVIPQKLTGWLNVYIFYIPILSHSRASDGENSGGTILEIYRLQIKFSIFWNYFNLQTYIRFAEQFNFPAFPNPPPPYIIEFIKVRLIIMNRVTVYETSGIRRLIL